jgi:hypothetical protein
MKTRPLIQYIPSTGDEELLARTKRFWQAHVPIPEPYDEKCEESGYSFVKHLAELEEERWDCFGPPLLAIADDVDLQNAVLFLKSRLSDIYSFGGVILNELEQRETARIKGK